MVLFIVFYYCLWLWADIYDDSCTGTLDDLYGDNWN